VTTPTFPLRAPPGTTHSPAPWHISGQSESGRYITVKAANGRTVARVPWNGENTPLLECTDAQDALLTSLAPELLAALEDMVALAIKLGNFAYSTDTSADIVAVRKTQALITKARGQ
jgi:hypothetical protein